MISYLQKIVFGKIKIIPKVQKFFKLLQKIVINLYVYFKDDF